VVNGALEAFDRVRLPFNDRLDASIREITHPTVQSLSSRRGLCEITKADALNAPAD
jgi:hypothetical protein